MLEQAVCEGGNAIAQLNWAALATDHFVYMERRVTTLNPDK